MPYIKKEDRERIAVALDMEPFNFGLIVETSGELNYVLTEIIRSYIDKAGDEKISYAKINEAIGALECCKLELYRRLAAPYEDKKITENGDVY